jgi:hypothetical protein
MKIFICLALTSILLLLPIRLSASEAIDITQYMILADNNVVGITVSSGFVRSSDGGRTWNQRNNGLPKKIVYPFKNDEYRRLTSFNVDPLNVERIVITDSSSIFLSSDGGSNWEEIPTGGPLKKSNYFTSVSLDPGNADRIILGTSFNGIFETNDSGKTWMESSIDLKQLYRGAGFYEEISGLGVDPLDPEKIHIAAGFSSGIFFGNYSNGELVKTDLQERISVETINGIGFRKDGPVFYSDDSFFYIEPETDILNKNSPLFTKNKSGLEYADTVRSSNSSDKTGIYINSFFGSGKRLDAHFTFMKKHGINSMVIDMKDDEGKITYNSNLELPLEMGAVRKRIDLPLLLSKARENDIYVIGRIVVFKDPMLYQYENHAYSIWDYKKNSSWGNFVKKTDSETGEESLVQLEFWVDPFSEFVWKYNIAIAEEIQTFGIDEVQFDYIRFPSDGDLSTVQYRNKKAGMTKIDALESFMRVAREKIFIPISTDLYGFNSWHRMGNWIGQNIEMLADYVDVISPMYYPSHFPSSFLAGMEYLDRAGYIYMEGTRRAQIITDNRALIRPYVQAFLIGKELNMEYEEYTRYLEVQIDGIEAAGGSGYTMWNNSNRYYMIAD